MELWDAKTTKYSWKLCMLVESLKILGNVWKNNALLKGMFGNSERTKLKEHYKSWCLSSTTKEILLNSSAWWYGQIEGLSIVSRNLRKAFRYFQRQLGVLAENWCEFLQDLLLTENNLNVRQCYYFSQPRLQMCNLLTLFRQLPVIDEFSVIEVCYTNQKKS